MTAVLHYGAGRQLRLRIDPAAIVAACGSPRGEPLADVRAATRAALAEPIGFPPLARAVVPGDRVALAIEPGLPSAASIVAAVVDAVVEGGVAAEDVTVLAANTAAAQQACADLEAPLRGRVRSAAHDPADRNGLTYLAAAADARPIYLNRVLHEADLVIPLGRLRLDDSLGYLGPGGVVYPTFADQAGHDLFRSPEHARTAAQRKQLRARVDKVAWLLGVTFTVQVVPGEDDQVLEVLAGNPAQVYERGAQRCRQAWHCRLEDRANLVVAAVAGEEPSWEDVGRALATAQQAAADEGNIALCTDLSARPGPAVRRLAGAESLRQARERVVHSPAADALTACQLVESLERGRVYLLSRLDQQLVEDLGMTPLADAAELERLAQRSGSCLLLENAQDWGLTIGSP